MSNEELDAAIRELKRTVDSLIAERRARRSADSMQSAPPADPNPTT